MAVILIIIAGVLALFFSVLYILLKADKLASQLEKEVLQKTKPKHPKQKKIRKLTLNIFIFLVLGLLSYALVYVSNTSRFEGLFKKAEKHRKIHKEKNNKGHLTPALPLSPPKSEEKRQSQPPAENHPLHPSNKPGYFSPSVSKGTGTEKSRELSQESQAAGKSKKGMNPLLNKNNNEEGLNINIFGERFMPASYKFTPIASSKTVNSFEKGNSPVFARLINSRKGDMFISAFYDQLTREGFIKSEKLKLRMPLARNKGELIKVRTRIPALKKGQTYQLPILLKSRAEPQSSGSKLFTLDDKGNLTPLRNLPEENITYSIERINSPLTMGINSLTTPELKREFQDIPEEIKDFLENVKGAKDSVKLLTAALVFNAYFGYQNRSKDVIREEGSTWNSLLKKHLDSNKRLNADCDVLSAFAFIYLKFLDLNPVLLISYYNSQDENILSAGELHANLYLKSGNRWVLFDPTLFSPKFAPKQDESEKIKKENAIERQVVLNQNYNRALRSDLTLTGLPYFLWPDKFRENTAREYSLTPDKAYFSKSMVKIIVDSLPSENRQKKKGQLSGILIQVSIFLYILSLIFTRIILLINKNKKPVFPKKKLNFLAYTVCLTLSFICTTASAVNRKTHLSPISVYGAITALILGILSVFSIISFAFSTNRARPALFERIFKEKVFILLGTLFSLSGVLYSPNLITIFTFIIIVITFIYEIKKG